LLKVHTKKLTSLAHFYVNLKKLEHRVKTELKKTIGTLEVSISEIKTLTGLLQICASCKKIRDDEGGIVDEFRGQTMCMLKMNGKLK